MPSLVLGEEIEGCCRFLDIVPAKISKIMAVSGVLRIDREYK